jgi:hypothetical protein
MLPKPALQPFAMWEPKFRYLTEQELDRVRGELAQKAELDAEIRKVAALKQGKELEIKRINAMRRGPWWALSLVLALLACALPVPLFMAICNAVGWGAPIWLFGWVYLGPWAGISVYNVVDDLGDRRHRTRISPSITKLESEIIHLEDRSNLLSVQSHAHGTAIVQVFKTALDTHRYKLLFNRRSDSPGFAADFTEYSELIEYAREFGRPTVNMGYEFYDHTSYRHSRKATSQISVVRERGTTTQSDRQDSESEVSQVSNPPKPVWEEPADQQDREVPYDSDDFEEASDLDIELWANKSEVDPARSIPAPSEVASNTDPISAPEELESFGRQYPWRQPQVPEPVSLTKIRKQSVAPERAYRQSARVVDWEQVNRQRKETGATGEDIVMAIEQQYLIDSGRPDLADQVQHVSKDIGDGAGYDILSFFVDGSSKYIEVKTTTGTVTEQFFLSARELEFIKRSPSVSYLYRVSIREEIPIVKVYEGGEFLTSATLTPTQFTVSLPPPSEQLTLGDL